MGKNGQEMVNLSFPKCAIAASIPFSYSPHFLPEEGRKENLTGIHLVGCCGNGHKSKNNVLLSTAHARRADTVHREFLFRKGTHDISKVGVQK
jgi:hypothetical protein